MSEKSFGSFKDLAKAEGVNVPRDERKGPPGGNPGGGDVGGAMKTLWPAYLEDGYFDAQGNLRPDYVARDKLDPLALRLRDLTVHQARRFFQHCRAIEALLKSKHSTWDKERTNLMRLDVAAQDAFGKKDRKIPELFHAFIRQNVAAVKTEKDFLEGFLPHFEALIGFSSGKLKDERGK